MNGIARLVVSLISAAARHVAPYTDASFDGVQKPLSENLRGYAGAPGNLVNALACIPEIDNLVPLLMCHGIMASLACPRPWEALI